MSEMQSSVVQGIKGYNSWPFVETIGDVVVCAYSRGLEHRIDERCRGVYARRSLDGGLTWEPEVKVVNTPVYCESAIGKGHDLEGAMLLWVRCIGNDRWHDLYRTADGLNFTRVASLRLDPMPMQITDIFAVPDIGLMALWFAGQYRDLPENAWGTLVSRDNGLTWEQKTIADGLLRTQWPTEPSCVWLGHGRLLAIARAEPLEDVPERCQFQLQSEDSGATWRTMRTNIRDVSQSTPSLVLSADGRTVRNYYYHRGVGDLKCRTAAVADIWDNPTAWPEPEVVATGSADAHHAGNVNAVGTPDGDYCTFYTGNEHQTEVVCVKVPRTEPAEEPPIAVEGESAQGGRIARWTQRLLDLSLRNRLLNVRDTKLVIPLSCPDIAVLEDKFSANETITLGSLADLLGEEKCKELVSTQDGTYRSDVKLLLDKELKQKRLWSPLPQTELSRRLKALYRQGRTDLEEGGVNTLFVALGFLEWKVSPREEKSYMAPLLLMPIRLQRKSVAEGIRISRLDEETLVNETLLELLRSQFRLKVAGLSPLPTDAFGVNVARILEIFRQAVRGMEGWSVHAEARLGLFSFGKFVMWTDMTARAEELKKNPLVKHLVEGGGIFDDGVEVFPPEEIGRHLDLKNLYSPMSADSSQLAAVLYSAMGKSFVLHGPPGTGKSQTITNLIAHNLAVGRRVLFVSEKKAALDVVHRRLSSVGLRPFCLELHSNKSGKSEVLAQFAEALNVPETRTPEEWETLTASLQSLRDELNAYVAELHRKYPNGLSAYDCFSRLAQAAPPQDGLIAIDCLTQAREAREQTAQLVRDFASACELLETEATHALAYVTPAEWTPAHERGLLAAAEALLTALAELEEAGHAVAQALELPFPATRAAVEGLVRLVKALVDAPDLPETLLTDDIAADAHFLEGFAETAKGLVALKEKLRAYNLEAVGKLDTAGLGTRLKANSESFFISRFFKDRALLKELAGLKKAGGAALTIQELTDALPDFAVLIRTQAAYEAGAARAQALLGNLWNGEATDWTQAQAAAAAAQAILETLRIAAEGRDAAHASCLARLRTLLPNARQNLAPNSETRVALDALPSAWTAFETCCEALRPYAAPLLEEAAMERLKQGADLLLRRRHDIRNILHCKKLMINIKESGLDVLGTALLTRRIDLAKAVEVFEAAYAKEMLDQLLAGNRVLAHFSGLTHEQRIARFCELDDQYMALTRQIVFAKLAATLPRRRSGPCPEGTELGLLKRECEKKMRQKPVRQLLAEIPTLAATLKPCFLMSPLSVAQYLPPDSEPFDLVVFDEASQIPVWDAIGVIARGRQLIVVGDPKQMPPTNFFQKGEGEEAEDSEEIEDMESILDECLAAGVHSSYLNWHYRSRHESLISFSNHYYYGDRLFTFPAASTSDRLGVKFRFVPGAVYDKSNSRTNRVEAEALVKYVFEQLEANTGRRRSFGVVTFSEAQRNLIEDMMDEERRRHPQLEGFFSEQDDEPPFVKNLENVQGDERDVILFSIGYAADADGKFSMNFGPLNRQGGERRLNVAITRAKEQVVVFSSVHGSQIELSRTGATGAAHLKRFLDYAEKGLDIQQKGGTADGASGGMAAAIAAFLQQKGYTVERNVGCSGYRIDLAVRHPDKPENYLLGIECDGAAYAAQWTARDRDHIRHGVLKGLGWHLWQAWSVDWTLDRPRAEAALLAAIEAAKNPPAPSAKKPSSPPTTPVAEKKPAPSAPPPPPAPPKEPYAAVRLRCGRHQERFYETGTRPYIREQFLQVVQQEGPICEKLLRRRVLKAWGFTRVGENIQAVLEVTLPFELRTTHTDGERVFWRQGQDPATYRDWRPNGADEESRRAIDEIPPEELANAMREVLADFSDIAQEALYREAVKLFGFAAVTQKARKCLDVAYGLLKP